MEPQRQPHDALMERLTQIVGLEITIDRVEAKFKLSQNRSDADRLNAAHQVSAAGHSALGQAMQPPPHLPPA